jgi:hypothetical protein
VASEYAAVAGAGVAAIVAGAGAAGAEAGVASAWAAEAGMAGVAATEAGLAAACAIAGDAPLSPVAARRPRAGSGPGGGGSGLVCLTSGLFGRFLDPAAGSWTGSSCCLKSI